MHLLRVHQIPSKILEIIDRSTEFCYLISPYFKPWNLLERTLRKAASDRKKLTFVFRFNEVSDDHIRWLSQELGFEVLLVERLHSKLYLNEKEALISSMNLHESSKDNNYETGVYFDAASEAKAVLDELVFGDILALPPKEKRSANGKAELRTESEAQRPPKRRAVLSKGFCVRCRELVPWSMEKPFCDECFSWWFRFSDWDYEERYCHLCGTSATTSMRRPVCYDCYKKNYDLINPGL